MSQESREAAKEVKEHLESAGYDLKRAAEKVVRVPDKDLQRKVREAVEKHEAATKHVKEGLEQK